MGFSVQKHNLTFQHVQGKTNESADVSYGPLHNPEITVKLTYSHFSLAKVNELSV